MKDKRWPPLGTKATIKSGAEELKGGKKVHFRTETEIKTHRINASRSVYTRYLEIFPPVVKILKDG